MIFRSAFVAASVILLAAAAPVAAAGNDLPYVTVTLDGFERAAIHKRAVSLMRTEYRYDDEGALVSIDTDVHRFDALHLSQLTTDGGAKAAFSLKADSRYVAWAQFLETGNDIMAYDLKRGRVVNVSNTPVNEDPFFDMEDDRFVWKRTNDAFGYDVVFFDGRRTVTVNQAQSADYPAVFQDPKTSGGKAAFGALGTDPEDGSFDSEVFFFDGRRLRKLTDDASIGDTSSGYDDGSALVSGQHVVFVTTDPVGMEPYQIRIYDGAKKPIRTVVRGGTAITGGRVLDDGFCLPLDFADNLLLWNGSIVDSGPVLLLTDVRTGETVSLDELTGGSVSAAATEDGYVGMFSIGTDGKMRVMVYHAKTKHLATAVTYDFAIPTSGVLSISGPNVAYNYYENDNPKVAIHYRSDEYRKELRRQ